MKTASLIALADQIRVSGNDNTVRYKRAIVAKRKTAVLDRGDDNSIKRVE